MKIITLPHPSLREVATPITQLDKKVLRFLDDLGDTLVKKDHPRGVGLAAPQVNMLWRAFATYLPKEIKEVSGRTRASAGDPHLQLFINPEYSDLSDVLTIGPDQDDPTLEGCLSIPGMYGPVPRHEWVELKYQEVRGSELVERVTRFDDFAARVVQHELDHLNGVLFIDHILQHGLPLFQDDGKKLHELSDLMVKAMIESSFRTERTSLGGMRP